MVYFLELKFDDEFCGKTYLRNNRSTGQKSLRCFPRCCDQGHKKQGFCGTPIFATAVIQKTNANVPIEIERVMIVGEIRPENEPGLALICGQKIAKNEILECIRSARNKPTNAKYELLAGEFRVLSETDDTYSLGIMLNEALHSYDYSWKSNRWASGTVTHVIDVIALSDDDNNAPGPHTISVLTSASSAPFVVASTKKTTVNPVIPGAVATEGKGKRLHSASASISVGPMHLRDTRRPFQLPMANGGREKGSLELLKHIYKPLFI